VQIRALILLVLGTAGFAAARDVAPADRPESPVLGQVIDRRQPAALNSPKFLAQRSIPAGLAERQWAIQNTLPTFGCYGFGYFPWNCWGWHGCYSIGFCNTWLPGTSIQTGSLPP